MELLQKDIFKQSPMGSDEEMNLIKSKAEVHQINNKTNHH